MAQKAHPKILKKRVNSERCEIGQEKGHTHTVRADANVVTMAAMALTEPIDDDTNEQSSDRVTNSCAAQNNTLIVRIETFIATTGSGGSGDKERIGTNMQSDIFDSRSNLCRRRSRSERERPKISPSD